MPCISLLIRVPKASLSYPCSTNHRRGSAARNYVRPMALWRQYNHWLTQTAYEMAAVIPRGESGAMGIWRAIKRQMRAAVAPCAFLLVTGYFCWNATQGTLGLKTYATRQQDLARAQTGLVRALAEQAVWAHRVAALQTARIDADALDERARAVLNLSEPNDIIVPYAKNDRLF